MRTINKAMLALVMGLATSPTYAQSSSGSQDMSVTGSQPAAAKRRMFTGIGITSAGLVALTAAPLVAYNSCPKDNANSDEKEERNVCRSRYAAGGLILAGVGAGIGVPMIVSGARDLRAAGRNRAETDAQLNFFWAGTGPGAALKVEF